MRTNLRGAACRRCWRPWSTAADSIARWIGGSAPCLQIESYVRALSTVEVRIARGKQCCRQAQHSLAVHAHAVAMTSATVGRFSAADVSIASVIVVLQRPSRPA